VLLQDSCIGAFCHVEPTGGAYVLGAALRLLLVEWELGGQDQD